MCVSSANDRRCLHRCSLPQLGAHHRSSAGHKLPQGQAGHPQGVHQGTVSAAQLSGRLLDVPGCAKDIYQTRLPQVEDA